NDLIKVNSLHQQDYTGQGLIIAVLDNGFSGVTTFSGFQNIQDNNQILGSYNFVQRNNNLDTGGTHGMSVLSTIAGFVDGELIGTAPDAEFYLFVTEDVNSETPLEESLWVEAVERADSLGVDIINTSLGYRAFDDSKYNHDYSDFDGNTTFIARGASILGSKGIIATIAAGNEGNSFHYISTPADASNVLTVGAVDQNGNMASFSSYGPTADGRIKPDVDAKGASATIINSSGNVSTGSGTSFASPILCGAVACLWQAFPDKNSYEIMQMIRESAHLYQNPDNHYGYGIPNFQQIFETTAIGKNTNESILVYPNPTANNIHISKKIRQYTLHDIYGSKILDISSYNADIDKVDMQNIPNGIYFLHIKAIHFNQTYKIIKNDASQ
ncbi:MAG TPA: T9SS type A sorting domain-containing protein, partial [Flavobacteriia bacterium]|nr:T9SS type A sorting domain-containing protein [Flavobacteriia bacterium]